MKTAIILFILTFSIGGIFAQEPAQPSVQDSIVFDKTTHNYGTITQGADGRCHFTFTNNGKSPLILTNVHASCGCTTPTWPREPIEPGKQGVIIVKYDTNRIGSFNKSITVNSNAANSTVILQIKGLVAQKQ